MKNKQDQNDFRQLESLLTNAELDDTGSKDKIFNRLRLKMETGRIQSLDIKKERINMKKTKWVSVAVSAFAVVLFSGVFSSTSYGQEMIKNIIARFQVGNMEILQYDKALPNPTNANEQVTQVQVPAKEASPKLSLEEARKSAGWDFPVPTWMPGNYQYVNTEIYGKDMVNVQFKNEKYFLTLLISQGGEVEIGTTDKVRIETIGKNKVYFANGIVIWEKDGVTFEMYQMEEKDFDNETMGKIIDSLSTEKK